jgi:hypothetical protein
MGKVRTWLLLAGAALVPSMLGGCVPGALHPFSMGLGTPVPVPPWVTERMEEKYCWQKDAMATIMPPIRPGVAPPICEDPPDMATILRAMPHVRRGFPYVYEEFRDDIDIRSERLVDKIDPGRFFPLIGPAQLHHCHWKCTIFYTETIESGYPFPFRCKRQRVEVVYIDRDHLHLCPGPNPAALESVTRDLSGP